MCCVSSVCGHLSCLESIRFNPVSNLLTGTVLPHQQRWNVYTENKDGQCGFGIGRYGRCDARNVYVENGALVLRSDRNHSCNAGEGCFNFTSGGEQTPPFHTHTRTHARACSGAHTLQLQAYMQMHRLLC